MRRAASKPDLTCIASKHLESHGILIDNQHGFRAKRSTQAQLISTTYDIAHTIQHNKEVHLAVLNLSLYYNNLIKESKGNTQRIWKAMNEASSRSSKSSSPNCIISDEVYYTDNKSIAEILNKCFVSVGQVLADKFMMATSDLRSGKFVTTTCFNL